MSIATKQRGFTLIELLVYVAGAVLIIGAIGSMLYYMYGWYDKATAVPHTDQIGVATMDRIVRDVRSAAFVNVAQSAFGTTTGFISVTGSVAESSFIKYFGIQNGRIVYSLNGGTSQYLTPSNVTVTRLQFTSTSTAQASAIRVELDLYYKTRQESGTRTYSGLAILRNSYQ